jgi:hypothetical protein
MSPSPSEIVGEWLQNLLDPEVVNRVVAPAATYMSLNTDNPELQKIMSWAGTSVRQHPNLAASQFRLHGRVRRTDQGYSSR